MGCEEDRAWRGGGRGTWSIVARYMDTLQGDKGAFTIYRKERHPAETVGGSRTGWRGEEDEGRVVRRGALVEVVSRCY